MCPVSHRTTFQVLICRAVSSSLQTTFAFPCMAPIRIFPAIASVNSRVIQIRRPLGLPSLVSRSLPPSPDRKDRITQLLFAPA
ncbi:hypothetical protein K461DRAFT_30147 [Myriangium duriaei CBS 260.36]|uniref:Uncharacterized protein n=1 Tax=Myriangium duriaei CBS 260.36 TaxID=1168546 RepID=A0A9P4JAK8_9PEZI|nr:hypothetical protein K461DRAFT_30147 [Myriangium duriaei CBS 260.36]